MSSTNPSTGPPSALPNSLRAIRHELGVSSTLVMSDVQDSRQISNPCVMRAPVDDDAVISHSSLEQQRIEKLVAELFRLAFEEDNVPTLLKNTHLRYLLPQLISLPSGFASLDASRPWIAFWVLHACDLLGHTIALDLNQNLVTFLNRCQHPSGGFGGGPTQRPHLATTYAAVNALCILGKTNDQAYKVIDRDGMHSFICRMKTPDGAFTVCEGGEVDTRGTYTALCVASLLNLMTPSITEHTPDWLARCQTYEGGIGGEPGNEAHGGYTFCGLAAMLLLRSVHKIDLDSLLFWATRRQMNLEGGFQGRTNKLVDACYSFWTGALFPMIDYAIRESRTVDQRGSAPTSTATSKQPRRCLTASCLPSSWLFNQLALQEYILIAAQDTGRGGVRDKPGKSADSYHTAFGLSGLSIAQSAPAPSYNVAMSMDRSVLAADPSPVLGGAVNQLAAVNMIYHLTDSALTKALEYFAALPSPSSAGTK